MTAVLAAGIAFISAVVKGSIGFGFPTLATPLLSLCVDVKTAVVVLILPNIAMDGAQFFRRGAPIQTVRRFWGLLAAGAVGTVLGTRLLVALSARTATIVLGAFILLFVASALSGVTPRVSPRWEPWVSPVAGLVAGVVGGITNVPGTPLVMYFHALGLDKHEFVASVAFSFVVYKLVQLTAVVYYALLPWQLVGATVGLTAVALVGFALGLRVQDRLEPRAFSRAVIAFLAILGVWLVARSV